MVVGNELKRLKKPESKQSETNGSNKDEDISLKQLFTKIDISPLKKNILSAKQITILIEQRCNILFILKLYA